MSSYAALTGVLRNSPDCPYPTLAENWPDIFRNHRVQIR